MEKEELKETVVITGTRDLLLETLTNIGCQYELAEKEDDNRIFFSYQGEHFFVDATNDWKYIQIWDMFWESVELYDIDEFSRLKKAVNGSNLNNSVTTIYTINEEGKTIDVHSKSVILFVYGIPEIEDYLKAELNDFFHAHQYVKARNGKAEGKRRNNSILISIFG